MFWLVGKQKLPMIKVSIVIVNYNTAQLTMRLLQSLTGHDALESMEIIVVDNASVDESKAVIRANFPSLKWIQNTENIGFGRAVNMAVAQANGAIIIVLNSDLIFDSPACSDVYQSFISSDARIGLATCRIVDEAGRVEKSVYSYNASFKEVLGYNRLLFKIFGKAFTKPSNSIAAVHGAFLVFHREVFEQVGGFDEDFFLYSEEFDLARRIQQAGYTLHCFDEITVIHQQEGSSIGKEWNQRQRAASIALLFRKKYGALGLLLYLILTLFNQCVNVLWWWRMNHQERLDYRRQALMHWKNGFIYFRLLYLPIIKKPIKV